MAFKAKPDNVKPMLLSISAMVMGLWLTFYAALRTCDGASQEPALDGVPYVPMRIFYSPMILRPLKRLAFLRLFTSWANICINLRMGLAVIAMVFRMTVGAPTLFYRTAYFQAALTA